jgi:orotidine-5'-phosphate decarboxylase
MNNPIVFVALDHKTQGENIDFANELTKEVESPNYGFKINLDSLLKFEETAINPYSFIQHIKQLARPVFVDLKMWNGARTMCNIAKGCADLGVDIINIYVHAGPLFIQNITDTLYKYKTKPKVFGLTVLTHYDEIYTQCFYQRNLEETIAHLVDLCDYYGCSGAILPGNMLHVAKKYKRLLKLCPGIRPEWFGDQKANYQEQVVTPSQAIEGGADYIVVGSPIRKSDNPPEALQRILEEMGVV